LDPRRDIDVKQKGDPQTRSDKGAVEGEQRVLDLGENIINRK